MVYCHECGRELKESAKFCNSCGAARKGVVVNSKKSSHHAEQEHKKPKSRLGLIILVLFLLFICYLGLNFWAIGQIRIDTSLDSVVNSISNFNFETGLLNTELGTSIRIMNPTIVPVLITKVSYDLSYGETIMGKGGTGFVFILPYSSTDTTIDFELSHLNTAKVAIEGIINIFQKEKKSLRMEFYAGFGPIKIPVGELG